MTGLLLAIVIAIAVAFSIVILLPAILLVVETLFVVLASVAFGRAWRVRAQTLGPPPEIREWRVRGLFRSRAAVREVADELRRGVHAEPEHALR